MATAWIEADAVALGRAIRLVDDAARGRRGTDAALLSLLDRLGLTPVGRLRLQWLAEPEAKSPATVMALPKRIASDGSYRDWNLIAPAFLGLGAAAVEAVYQLPPPKGRVPAEIITRSLVDYTITFGWLAAPTDESERAERLLRFEVGEYNDRLEVDKRYTTILPDRNEGAYARMIAAGRMPASMLPRRCEREFRR
jgi:hypothetical protein